LKRTRPDIACSAIEEEDDEKEYNTSENLTQLSMLSYQIINTDPTQLTA
jgi:hypothetical protein